MFSKNRTSKQIILNISEIISPEVKLLLHNFHKGIAYLHNYEKIKQDYLNHQKAKHEQYY
jgi:hypothetical protein